MCIPLAREEKLGNRVGEELCRVEIDAEEEVLEVCPTFRYFGKAFALG